MSEPTLPIATPVHPCAQDEDPHQWLEEVDSERALAWVRERNAHSEAVLTARPEYAPTREQLLAILDAKDRIPSVVRRGDWLYNLWQDGHHRRGLWRRTTLADYRTPEPAWETVLDLDALALAEGENWVWGGAEVLGPEYRHALVSLSRGGADATVIREFDLASRQFVEGGFALPEAKSELTWIDAETVYVSTDFGEGSMTESGYPRIVKRWRRGTPLASAVTVFEGDASDVGVGVGVDRTPGFERTVFTRMIDFYRHEVWLIEGPVDGPDAAPVRLDVPDDAIPDFLRGTLLLQLRSDLVLGSERFSAGSLVHADAAAWLRGERAATALFTPTATRSLAGYDTTRGHVLLQVMDNVAERLELWHRPGGEGDGEGGPFVGRAVDTPFPGQLGVTALYDPLLADDPLAEHYLLSYTDFTTPASLFLASTAHDERELLKAGPARFDAEGMRTEQCFATSADGTRVPYFVLWPRGAQADGNNPTLIYGYGGFEHALTPWYAADYGRAWCEQGGVLVVANLRGGGEYGPAWHQAAVREHKQRSYDDLIAIAQDLIARGVTRPAHLGIQGGSNGGLLVGAVMVQRPDLFNAVVCQVPLLDMRRYHTLLAGASWMAEYGDPDDPADWAFLARYSPYHQVRADARYPRVLFTTSTRDDRVHPGHARKMAARMLAQGHDLLYYENTEGGHGGAADNAQRAHLLALEFAYLWQQLGAGSAAASTAG
ncbi:prolyl oligopeptidase family serine peptidase [Acidovorax sp. NCPPB 3576]|uniref:prolyl oligopeptidase family serine peptidase n=1 Tax=Acidovorax sp. NCPPB 3576 TaxID=2940488 RepID=UPI002349284C|nr:prolyl oligopeptidase family serine peptidase [Acidovorax sp. NCPPB 3576]WCM86711.1 prolyl oligopeptidase family serine peptidase [Acidovorax sp. NCPPB 3576]